MKEWTKRELDQILNENDEEQLKQLHDSIEKSSYRCEYHIQTVTGLMNDPNGFSYYDHQWHLFYQWFPYGAVHGMKHWYHVVSDDLVHWKNIGLGMKPTLNYDNFGCYSGSGFVKNDFLYLVYTGNHNEPNGQRIPYQMIAAIDAENHLTKLRKPIIQPQQGYTEHQRDPKIFYENGYYYILLGSQNEKLEGKLLMYRSEQIATGWTFVSELKIEGYDHFGYMVECPCIEKIGNQWLLLFSPQGLERKEDAFLNAYANVYMIGDLDLETMTFKPLHEMKELDKGFDFYAAQTAHQSEYENTAILEGWFGCSDYTYPTTDEEGWAGLQTLARELTIQNGKLIQRPSRNLERIKKDVLFEAVNGVVKKDALMRRTPDACIIHLENPSNSDIELDLFATDIHKGFAINYNARKKCFMISRKALTNQMNTEFGTERSISLDSLKSLDIFVDHSAIEIFINDGEEVMSSRVFPTKEEHKIRMSGKDINLKIWSIEKAVEDDFKL